MELNEDGLTRAVDETETAHEASRRAAVPTLFDATGNTWLRVVEDPGEGAASAVEASIECLSGAVITAPAGFVGPGDPLRAVPRNLMEMGWDRLLLGAGKPALKALAVLETGEWPWTALAA